MVKELNSVGDQVGGCGPDRKSEAGETHAAAQESEFHLMVINDIQLGQGFFDFEYSFV